MLGARDACRGPSGRRTRTVWIRARARLQTGIGIGIRGGAGSEIETNPFALRRAVPGPHTTAGSRHRAIGLSVQEPLRPPRPVDAEVSRAQQVSSSSLLLKAIVYRARVGFSESKVRSARVGEGAPTQRSSPYGEGAQRRPGESGACNAAKNPRALGIHQGLAPVTLAAAGEIPAAPFGRGDGSRLHPRPRIWDRRSRRLRPPLPGVPADSA